jgi:hypothetical protein
MWGAFRLAPRPLPSRMSADIRMARFKKNALRFEAHLSCHLLDRTPQRVRNSRSSEDIKDVLV